MALGIYGPFGKTFLPRTYTNKTNLVVWTSPGLESFVWFVVKFFDKPVRDGSFGSWLNPLIGKLAWPWGYAGRSGRRFTTNIHEQNEPLGLDQSRSGIVRVVRVVRG
jgi:hypothetical protein